MKTRNSFSIWAGYPLFFLWLFLTPTIFMAGCVSSKINKEQPLAETSFKTKKSTAWEALLIVFKDYPKKNVNEEAGIIETEEMRVGQVWEPITKQRTTSVSYRLKATLSPDPPYTRAIIEKITKRQKDFFSKPEIISSDLVEEETLLYRLGREIKIKKLIKKLYK